MDIPTELRFGKAQDGSYNLGIFEMTDDKSKWMHVDFATIEDLQGVLGRLQGYIKDFTRSEVIAGSTAISGTVDETE